MRGAHGRMRTAAVLAAAGCALLGGVAWGFYVPARAPGVADAENTALATQGRHVYAAHCASCHGRTLQGQPLWQMQDADTHRRAPALDRFGPAWLQSDATLFGVIKAGGGAMPELAGSLGDDEIVSVIAFIKTRWPVGLRVAQAMLNPGGKGAPRAAASRWLFPPNCLPPER